MSLFLPLNLLKLKLSNDLARLSCSARARFTSSSYIYELKDLVNSCEAIPANIHGTLIYELIILCGTCIRARTALVNRTRAEPGPALSGT